MYLCILKQENKFHYYVHIFYFYKSVLYSKTAFSHSLERDTESHDLSSDMYNQMFF